MLEYNDAKCGGWADFLLDVMRAQGITSAELRAIGPVPTLTIGSRTFMGVLLLVQPSARAQGNNSPVNIFTDHAAVFYDGRIWDPSYGIKTNSVSISGQIAGEDVEYWPDWEAQALKGIRGGEFILVPVPGTGQVVRQPIGPAIDFLQASGVNRAFFVAVPEE